MNTLIVQLLILGLFAVKTARDAAYYAWVLQIKEYRLDRLRAYWKDNAEFRNHLLLSWSLIAFLWLLETELFELTQGVALAYLIIGTMLVLRAVKNRALRRPQLTPKIKIIIGAYLGWLILMMLFLHFWPSTSNLSRLVIISLLTPWALGLVTVLITPLANRQKKRILERARLKMTKMKRLKTIGVTGSYGKTSTKEFLFAILSTKYNVVKTAGNNNTAMGVAQTVLNQIDEEADYFVCEMGAYKRDEIAEICELVKPYAGIITGINEQHLDLFGSLLNTKRAKFELAESLPKEGFVAVNRAALALEPRIDIAAEEIPFSKEDLFNLSVKPTVIQFTYSGQPFTLYAMGGHYAENLLAAIITAEKLGMSLAEISHAVSNLKVENPYLMRKIIGPSEAIFLDDSYSANPTGVLAALEYMQAAYPQHRKIMVFPGVIELGKNSEKIHEPIWKKTDEICDIAYIMQDVGTGDHWHREHCLFIFEQNFAKIKESLKPHLNANTVVLFESRGAGVVMQKLLNEK